MTARISSQRYAVEDFQEALDLCYRRGWTDGLPVVPPTEPSVRAMLLVMRNVIGTMRGRLDRGTFGRPGGYTYVMAENEAESPWTPLHVERIGCRPTDSAVTVMAALAPIQFYNQLSSTAAGVLS